MLEPGPEADLPGMTFGNTTRQRMYGRKKQISWGCQGWMPLDLQLLPKDTLVVASIHPTNMRIFTSTIPLRMRGPKNRFIRGSKDKISVVLQLPIRDTWERVVQV